MGKFNSDDHYIYYCGLESLRWNGVALIVKKESKMQYLGTISKMTELSLFVSKASLFQFSRVRLFVTPWTVARQASLSIPNFRSLLKLMFIESVMPSNSHPLVPFSSCLQSFPASGSFSMNLFQGKPFNTTVIQVYAPTTTAEETEVEWFYDNLQDLLELTPKKDVHFIMGDWNAK